MERALDLLLVNPGARDQVYGKLGVSLSGIEPPLWCGLLAGFIREKGFSVKILDAEAENLSPDQAAQRIADLNPCLTGIIVLGSNPSAASTPKMTAAGQTLRELHMIAPRIKTLLGGLHPSALPERTLNDEMVDFVCQGEGFSTILQLLDTLRSEKKTDDYRINGLWYKRNGAIVSNPPAEPVKNLDELPFAAWDLLPMDLYRAHNWHCFGNLTERDHYAVIYTSLGCPFNCNYCNIHALYGKPGIRFRSPEKVIEEIDLLVKTYRIKNLKIIDELFVLNQARVRKICELLIDRGYSLNIWAYARVDTVNESLMKTMKQAGINWLAFGIESASENVREGVTKRFSQETIKNAIRITQDAGICVLGNFIFGLPDDTLQTMQETLDLAKELNLEYINFYTAMAYPGSLLYFEAIQNGIPLPDQWHGFSQYGEDTLPMPTKFITADEVLRFRDYAFTEYFSNPLYLNMIREKFGPEVENHIKGLLKHKIHRKYA
jgi:radical SAM superfamily enzyme YgiQ (UPF0313 family)